MRTLTRAFRSWTVVALATLPAATVGAQLPPGIAADRLVVRAEFHAGRGEFEAALASLDEALALRGEHGLETPPVAWFRQAQVERMASEHARAAASLTRYVTAAGRDGEHYWLALEMLDASERHREAAGVAERARREGRPFADALASGGIGPRWSRSRRDGSGWAAYPVGTATPTSSRYAMSPSRSRSRCRRTRSRLRSGTRAWLAEAAAHTARTTAVGAAQRVLRSMCRGNDAQAIRGVAVVADGC